MNKMKEFDEFEYADNLNDEKKFEEQEHLANYPKLDDELDGNSERCCHCGEMIDMWDLDKCDSGWICKDCEDKLK